jgi:hypothetical protein
MYQKGTGTYTRSIDILKLGEYDIILLEKFPCNSRDELTAREQYYIDLYGDICVNKQKAFTPLEGAEYKKEWYEDNKEQVLDRMKKHYEINKANKLEYQKQYAVENKDKIKEYNKQYRENKREELKQKNKIYKEQNKEKLQESSKQRAVCDICGKDIRKYGLNRHKKTVHNE